MSARTWIFHACLAISLQKEMKQKKVTQTEQLRTHTLVFIWVSEGHRGSNKWSQRFWGPGCTWQPVSSSPCKQTTQKQYRRVGRIGTHMCVHVCLCPFPDLILPPPLFHLILLIPLCQHQAFPLMKCLGPYTVLTLYLFSFILSPSPQLIFRLSLLHCLWAFISHLAGKGNKRPTYWGSLAPLCHFAL